jgi:predicted DNA-binding transcriptional regulator AlpA
VIGEDFYVVTVTTVQEGTEMPQNLITAEVAELVRAPIETVRYWRHVGKGPKSFKVGRRVLYAIEDVDAWIAQAKANTAVQ